MQKIIAIGGGEIEQSEHESETLEIDREILKLTNKASPKLLFIPTASGDSLEYCEKVKRYFGDTLDCSVDTLLLSEEPPVDVIRDKILSSDIVYVGGGNTLKMMESWREFKIGELISEAVSAGVVLSGLSAGAICWFKYGHSDSNRLENIDSQFIKVRGLNMLPFLLCPHYDEEDERVADLKEMMKDTEEVAIALDNCCAIEIVDTDFRIITSKEGAQARKIFWLDGQYHESVIEQGTGYRPLNELSKKS